MNLKNTLLLLFISLGIYACNEDTSPSDSLVTGDRNTVQNFKNYEDSDLELISETAQNGWNSKSYALEIDLDEDGIEDFALTYVNSNSITGFRNYSGTIYPMNNSFRAMGDSLEIVGDRVWLPIWLNENEFADRSSYVWNSRQSQSISMSYYEGDNNTIYQDFNFFPEGASNGYAVFTMLDAQNRQILGWIHVRHIDEFLKPQLVDIGYNYLN
jgi:hypothetical protein